MSTSNETWRTTILIGHAERESAANALGEHFAAGRLDQHEFDERAGAAYAARTYADLDVLFTDLPKPHPARPADVPPHSDRPSWRWPPAAGKRGGGWPSNIQPGRWLAGLPWPALVVLAVGVVWVVGVVVVMVIRALVFALPFMVLPLICLWLCVSRWRYGRRYRGHRR